MSADVPEGFPLHLFSSPGSRGWVLAIGEELAALDLVPVQDRGERRLIIVARSRTAPSERSREAIGHARVFRVVAAPDRLPFRDRSAVEVIVSSGGHGRPSGVERLVRERGRILALARPKRLKPGSPPSRSEAGSRTFVLWPLPGGAFLVTRSPAPDPWPFDSVHLGRPSTLLAAAFKGLSRVAPRRIPGRILLTVRSRSEVLTVAEARAGPRTSAAFGMVVKPGRNAILLAGGEADGNPERERVVKFPLSEPMVERTRRGLAAIESLREKHGPSVVARVPRVLESDFDACQPWATEERLPGRSASRGWWIPGHYRRVAERAVAFLIDLHRESATHSPLTRAEVEARLTPPLQRLEAACREVLAADATGAGPREARAGSPGATAADAFPVAELRNVVTARVAGRAIPLVRSHGDLWPPNLLLDDRGELTGVLDWDRSREDAWPLVDLLHLFALRHRRVAARWFARLVRWRLLRRGLRPWEGRLAARYMEALELPQDLWTPLAVIYWLELADWRVEALQGRRLWASWIRRNVWEAAPHMLRALSLSP